MIYNSRTFCLFEDIEMIKKNGLAKVEVWKMQLLLKVKIF